METTGIEPLNSENYNTWSEDVKVLLIDRNSWDIITEVEKPPGEAATDKVRKDYALRKARAYSTIYLNVSREYRPLISQNQEGKSAWKTLQEHFRPDSKARAVELTDSFFSCRLEEGEAIGLFAARLRKIIEQLIDAGQPISEFHKAFQLIRSLPPDFKGIVQSIYRWDEDKFKFDEIVRELLAEEARLKLTEHDPSSMALHINPRRNKFREAQPKMKNNDKLKMLKCTKCSKFGHTDIQCRSKIKEKQSSYVVEANYSGNTGIDKTAWVFDTAATSHFCGNRNLFTNFEEIKNEKITGAIGGMECPVEGKGIVKLRFEKNSRTEIVILNNVLYSPKIRRNLIAGSLVEKAGSSFWGKDGKIHVYGDDDREIFTATRKNGLYYCYPRYTSKKIKNKPSSLATMSETDPRIWHQRFCHINSQYVNKTSKNDSVRGLPNLDITIVKCESCRVAKQKRRSFKPIGKIRSEKPLELVHMDVCGPLPNPSLNGHKYFLSITDDFSRRVTVYPLKKKSDVFECFTRFQARGERFLNSKIVNVRIDNGMEFVHKEFSKFLEDQGIKAERTNIYSPEQNGVSERYNLTAMDAVKAMLNDAGLSNGFWAEALLCFTYVWNRVCHGNNSQTPFERYSGRKPSVKHLKSFGSTAYVGIPKQLRNKLAMRAKKGIMVGYAQQTRGYRIWLPAEKKVLETMNVTFDEVLKREPNSESSGAKLDPTPKFKYVYPKEETSDSDSENEDPKFSPLKEIKFTRVEVPRKDKSRTDIYYYPEGSTKRLRSKREVEEYCDANNIIYCPDNFNFSGKTDIDSDDESDLIEENSENTEA